MTNDGEVPADEGHPDPVAAERDRVRTRGLKDVGIPTRHRRFVDPASRSVASAIRPASPPSHVGARPTPEDSPHHGPSKPDSRDRACPARRRHKSLPPPHLRFAASGRFSQIEGFCRKAVTVSRAVPASAPMIAPTQASKREMPLQSGLFPKSANPSPAPSPPVSKDTPTILAISAMVVPSREEIDRQVHRLSPILSPITLHCKASFGAC